MNTEILEQVKEAMEIVKESYPDDNHLFIYDNATTHLKCADDALSARKMPKFPSEMWGIEVNKLHPNGKQVFTDDGKYAKMKIRVGDGTFNGAPQSFYFPEGHEKAGWFKGMATILEECGFANASRLKAQCKDFKCAKGATSCCCRRILYEQPDFVNVKSVLEAMCEAEGFRVMFLPKFHCELNPIEQCWGYAKRVYRMCPASSKEEDLEKNVIYSLESIPLTSIWQ